MSKNLFFLKSEDIPTAENEKIVEDGDVDDPASKAEPLDPVAVEEALKMIREFKPKKPRKPLPLFPGRLKAKLSGSVCEFISNFLRRIVKKGVKN